MLSLDMISQVTTLLKYFSAPFTGKQVPKRVHFNVPFQMRFFVNCSFALFTFVSGLLGNVLLGVPFQIACCSKWLWAFITAIGSRPHVTLKVFLEGYQEFKWLITNLTIMWNALIVNCDVKLQVFHFLKGPSTNNTSEKHPTIHPSNSCLTGRLFW